MESSSISETGMAATAIDESPHFPSDEHQTSTPTQQQNQEQPEQAPAPQRSSQNGIDIRKALEILSNRSKSHDHDHSHHHDHDGIHDCHSHVPEEAKAMGQTIDLFGSSTTSSNDATAASSANAEGAENEEAKQAQRRREQIQQELQGLSTKQLLQAVLKAQQERVATYRHYDSGLETILKSSGNITHYPAICAQATASFAVLSNTIRSIQTILSNRLRQLQDCNKDERTPGQQQRIKQYREYVELLTTLQQQEQKKLNLTAALHLEKIRQQNELSQPQEDERVTRLLGQGVVSLTRQVASVMEVINEVLDEIQCSMLDDEEE